MASAKYKYTLVAHKAASLADLFASQFEKGLDGPVHFRVELAAPDGPSTAGGKQALQHIKLVPDAGGPAIVIGSANAPRMLAEVRTFEHIAALYAQRFHGAAIPVDVTRYYELGQAAAAFFRAMGMQVTFVEQDGTVSAAPGQVSSLASLASGLPRGLGAPAAGTRLLMALGALVVGLVVLVAAYFMYLRH